MKKLNSSPVKTSTAFLLPLPGPVNNCGLSSVSSVTPSAAAPARGSGSTFPAPPQSPQRMETMHTEPKNRCPICLDSWEEASYVLPCLHQFCYPCIVRWSDSKTECPLCRKKMKSILSSNTSPLVGLSITWLKNLS
uniref:RING-type E3 ubiquitin transferase n=1 Tax=Accipiter nisus TaxID=211598 RepID=A0A8B9MD94_9AVES